MDKLRLALKLVTAKSRAEKAILSLASDTGLNSSFDKPVNTLLEIFSNERQLHEDHASFDMLLKYLRKSNSWATSIKLLFASHCLMIKIGAPFCRAFTREEFDNIHNFSKTKQGLYSIYEVMTANYYSFLLCFASYYEEIEKLSHKRSQEIVKSIKNNESTYLSQLLNLNELTKYVTKIEACIKESLTLRKYKYLFEKIASMIIRETTIVNNIITDVLEESKDFIFKAEPRIAFMLDELYSSTIQNTKKLKPFLEELDLPYSSNVTPMKYFEFDPDFNYKEELYILDLKKSHPDPYQKHQTEKSNRREILSPSEIEYSKQHDINYKQPKKIDAPGIQIKKAGTRSPLGERRNLYEKDLISPEPSDRKNFLKAGAISPEISSPSSTDLLNDHQRLEGDSVQGPDEESIYKSRGFLSESGANAKGKEGNLMKKKGAVVPEKENFENNDLYSTDLVS